MSALRAVSDRHGGRVARSLRSLKVRSQTHSLTIVLVLSIMVFGWLRPALFLQLGNVEVMLRSQAVLFLLALAVTLSLRAGDFDLSLSATMGFNAALVGTLITAHDVPLLVAVVGGIMASVVIGLMNSLFVVKFQIHPFIVTLGMMTALIALTFAVSSSQVFILGSAGQPLTSLVRMQLMGIPMSVLVGWFLAVVLWYVYERTALGRHLLIVGGSRMGGNRDEAYLMGLRVNRLRVAAFVGGSVVAGATGLVLLGTLGAVDPRIAHAFLLPPFIAAFLGATSIRVGQFNVVGTVLALYLLAVLVTGLQLVGIKPWMSEVVDGLALIGAIYYARIARRRYHAAHREGELIS